MHLCEIGSLRRAAAATAHIECDGYVEWHVRGAKKAVECLDISKFGVTIEQECRVTRMCQVPSMQRLEVHGQILQTLCIEELAYYDARRHDPDRVAELLHGILKIATGVQMLAKATIGIGHQQFNGRRTRL